MDLPSEVYEFAYSQLNKIKNQNSHLTFNQQDWEDLIQEIVVKIYKKRVVVICNLRDRASFHGYIKTMIYNLFKNYMRDLTREAKYGIRFPTALLTKIIETDEFDSNEMVYVPDLIKDDDNICLKEIEQVDRIIESLSFVEKDVLSSYRAEGCWGKGSKDKKMQALYQRRLKIGKRAIDKIRIRLSYSRFL